MNRIYVDHAATTPMSEGALAAMLPYFRERFGNPSALHSYGQEAKKAIEAGRRTIARAIGAASNEIYFTSGGTESDNWALHSACEMKKDKGRHIIATAIEHNAVLQTLEKLRSEGCRVTLLLPDERGQLTAERLEAAIRADTVLISVMLANNVVGTVLRIGELCDVAHRHGILFHTDAVQAVGHIPVDVRKLGVDMLSLSAHKFHGPKGAGALFSKLPRRPPAHITGGGQERGGRSGTENVAGIVGMAAALEACVDGISEHMRYLVGLRDRLIERTLAIPGAHLTGDPVARLPGHASFLFDGIGHSARLIAMLDEAGICASAGAACSASAQEASHVLESLGFDAARSQGALRISLSIHNTEAEIDAISDRLPIFVARLRRR
ncbi:MAG: cysteine desulfurase [Clostridiales Family XIII bacterium]|jgi:cysteine desulfurase|nr:cysteine desulfurase [Clostridiales Family XIII bacterium]